VGKWIRHGGSSLADRRALLDLMVEMVVADRAQRAGRAATRVPRAAAHPVAIVPIAHAARVLEKDSAGRGRGQRAIPRDLDLRAMPRAHKGSAQGAINAHKGRGLAAINAHLALATTTTGAARGGLRQRAGAVAGMSRRWLKRIPRRVRRLRLHPLGQRRKSRPRLPRSRQRPRRNSFLAGRCSIRLRPESLGIAIDGSRCSMSDLCPVGWRLLVGIRLDRRNRGKQGRLAGVDRHGAAATPSEAHHGHDLGRLG